MKKRYLLATTVCLLGAVTLGVACKDNGNSSSGDGGENKETALINGFENWDDLKELEIDKALFNGTLSVNRETAYLSEGQASAKYEVDGVSANNPSFKMLATAKPDITDVSQFCLYVYNANDYEFSVIISALDASDGIIYTQDALAAVGANTLTFDVDRQMVQTTGSSVAKFQLAFNGLTPESVIYLDNFYAKLSSEKVELDAEVKAVVTAIEHLQKNNRTAVEGVMSQYKALTPAKRKAVHNYQILKATMDTFWLDDLTSARAQDTHTLLFFDKPFAEVQVSTVSHSISVCDYTTEKAYGDETGSLKVGFTKSSVNWVTVDTTADVPVEEEYIKLHVYNNSTQEKVLCLGWKGPGKDGTGYWKIAPNSWLDIECPSTYLTANKGGIQIAGFKDGRGIAPEGEVYISAVKTFDKASNEEIYNALRVGEDTNTLFFFDSEMGEGQLNSTDANLTFAYTDSKPYKNENGSMQISLKGSHSQGAVNYDVCGYNYTENDYAVFYVYNDTNTDFVSLLFSYDNGVRLAKGEWTTVVRKVSEIDGCHLRFMGQNYVEVNGMPTANQVQANVSGDLYISKAKVYSSSTVEKLFTATEGENATPVGDWTLGETTFTGATARYNTNWNTLMDNPLEYEAYMINGELRMVLWAHEYAGFYATLKTPVDISAEDTYVAITLKGASDEKFTIFPMGSEGQYDAIGTSIYASHVIPLENGYSTHVFKITQRANTSVYGFRITPIGATKYSVSGQTILTAAAVEVRISNFVIGNAQTMENKGYFENMLTTQRTGAESNTLLFFDRRSGREQLTSWDASLFYTTEKAYDDEAGSFQLWLTGNVGQPTIRYNVQDYNYNAGDYAVFYVYNDTDTDFVQLMFGYNNSVYLEKGKWTMVVRKVDTLANQYFRFFSMNNTNSGAPADWTSASAKGSLYISKVKVYSASEITDLGKATGDWTIGDTTFTGATAKYNNAIGNPTYAGFLADDLQYAPYLYDGALYMTLWEHSYAGFYAKLKTAVDVSQETQYVAITMKGADVDKFTILPLGAGGEYDALTGALKPIQTIAGEDGYATYIFEVPATADKTISGLRITPLGNTTASWKAVNISISNISIGNLAMMQAKGFSI